MFVVNFDKVELLKFIPKVNLGNQGLILHGLLLMVDSFPDEIFILLLSELFYQELPK